MYNEGNFTFVIAAANKTYSLAGGWQGVYWRDHFVKKSQQYVYMNVFSTSVKNHSSGNKPLRLSLMAFFTAGANHAHTPNGFFNWSGGPGSMLLQNAKKPQGNQCIPIVSSSLQVFQTSTTSLCNKVAKHVPILKT